MHKHHFAPYCFQSFTFFYFSASLSYVFFPFLYFWFYCSLFCFIFVGSVSNFSAINHFCFFLCICLSVFIFFLNFVYTFVSVHLLLSSSNIVTVRITIPWNTPSLAPLALSFYFWTADEQSLTQVLILAYHPINRKPRDHGRDSPSSTIYDVILFWSMSYPLPVWRGSHNDWRYYTHSW